jgi:heme-degrading monooxygenase HmoA
MIARTWRGAVRREDGDAYADYLSRTGVPGYLRTDGNRGLTVLRREVDDRCEFLLITLWESLDSVKAFAGPSYETAVFYPEDDRYLVERDHSASHWKVLDLGDGS